MHHADFLKVFREKIIFKYGKVAEYVININGV